MCVCMYVCMFVYLKKFSEFHNLEQAGGPDTYTQSLIASLLTGRQRPGVKGIVVIFNVGL